MRGGIRNMRGCDRHMLGQTEGWFAGLTHPGFRQSLGSAKKKSPTKRGDCWISTHPPPFPHTRTPCTRDGCCTKTGHSSQQQATGHQLRFQSLAFIHSLTCELRSPTLLGGRFTVRRRRRRGRVISFRAISTALDFPQFGVKAAGQTGTMANIILTDKKYCGSHSHDNYPNCAPQAPQD